MSSSLFDFALSFNQRDIEVQRRGTNGFTMQIKASNDNYNRKFENVANVTTIGKGYVISASQGYTPRRGDALIDKEVGTFIISEVHEMVYNGNIVGYRIRTS